MIQVNDTSQAQQNAKQTEIVFMPACKKGMPSARLAVLVDASLDADLSEALTSLNFDVALRGVLQE